MSTTGLLFGLGALVVASPVLAELGLSFRLIPKFKEPVPSDWTDVETVRLTTPDGLSLGAWFAEGHANKAQILLLHGNWQSKHAIRGWFRQLVDRGFSVLSVSLRAHGESDGRWNFVGLEQSLDVQTAINWLEQRDPGRTRLVVAFSMGTAATLFAGDALRGKVHGLLLDAPFEDLQRAARNRIFHYVPPGLSHLLYHYIMASPRFIMPKTPKEISPLEAAKRLTLPLEITVIGTLDDPKCQRDEVRAIAEALGPKVHLELMQGRAHRPVFWSHPARVLQLIDELAARTELVTKQIV